MVGSINKNPLVSVIIPVYNVSPFIEECINSVINQTYSHLEVIIVDDCCTDDSMEKAEKIINGYDGRIAFSIVHHKQNAGLSAARNTGLDLATGEYISFIDSDDYIMSTLYETLIKAITEDKDRDIAILGCRCFSNKRINNEGIEYNLIIPPQSFAEEFLSAKTIGVVWAKLFQRHLFDSIRFREGRNGEDFLFMYDLYPIIEKQQYKTVILPDQLYYYRIREDSISSSKKPYNETKTKNLLEVVKGLKKANHICIDAVEKRYVRHIYYYCLSLAEEGKIKDYYRYCFKMWGVSSCSANKKLPDKSDFKVFLMIKYLPFVYYYFVRCSLPRRK